MRKLTFFFVFFVSFLTLINFNGCSEETVGPLLVPITDGAFILSEGTNPTNSKLSFYSVINDSFYQSIYSGNLSYPDGLVLHGDYLYLVEQGPNFGGPGKLYKLDLSGNLVSSSQPFGSSPYSLTIANNKIFVTNGPGSNVSVLDINSLNVVDTITVGVYPQEILAVNNKVFVCNTSAFGGNSDSTVSVIDASNNSVLATLTLRKDPTALALQPVSSSQFNLYAGCQGGGGIIYKINPNTLTEIDSFNVTNGFDKDMNAESGLIYFISASNNIDRLDPVSRIVTTQVTNPNPASMYFYGYNYDKLNGKHYILDAKNFLVNGSLQIYSSTGALEKTFTTGVGPRRIVFKIGTGSGGS